MYDRNIGDKTLTFGVSGLLYKSNVLMYDHQTESLWLQVKREAVTGPMTGTPLKVFHSTLTTWKKWKKRFPETEVLSTDTGYTRNYSRDPYEDYYRKKKGFFSFFRAGPGEEEKELVAGITINGKAKAYPVDTVRNKGTITDWLNNTELTVTLDNQTDMLTIKDAKGREIPYITVYWFVWKGIYPESSIFHP